MIKTRQSENSTQLMLMPNRSLSWQGNKSVIWVMGIICIGIALAFTLLTGAWVILPFAGLEIVVLGSTLYYVSWKLSYRHIITITNDEVLIEKGVYHPRGRWVFPRRAVRLEITPPAHDWEAKSLAICHGNDEIDVGNFLSREDMQQLVDILAMALPQHAAYR